MTEKLAAESPTPRSTLERVVPSAVEASWHRLRAGSSITRLGAVGVACYAGWFAFVIPDELALLLLATMAGFALAGLVPLAFVVVIVRFPL